MIYCRLQFLNLPVMVTSLACASHERLEIVKEASFVSTKISELAAETFHWEQEELV